MYDVLNKGAFSHVHTCTCIHQYMYVCVCVCTCCLWATADSRALCGIAFNNKTWNVGNEKRKAAIKLTHTHTLATKWVSRCVHVCVWAQSLCVYCCYSYFYLIAALSLRLSTIDVEWGRRNGKREGKGRQRKSESKRRGRGGTGGMHLPSQRQFDVGLHLN